MGKQDFRGFWKRCVCVGEVVEVEEREEEEEERLKRVGIRELGKGEGSREYVGGRRYSQVDGEGTMG